MADDEPDRKNYSNKVLNFPGHSDVGASGVDEGEPLIGGGRGGGGMSGLEVRVAVLESKIRDLQIDFREFRSEQQSTAKTIERIDARLSNLDSTMNSEFKNLSDKIKDKPGRVWVVLILFGIVSTIGGALFGLQRILSSIETIAPSL